MESTVRFRSLQAVTERGRSHQESAGEEYVVLLHGYTEEAILHSHFLFLLFFVVVRHTQKAMMCRRCR